MPGALGPTDSAFRQPRGYCNIHTVSLFLVPQEKFRSETEAAQNLTKKKSVARIEYSCKQTHQGTFLTYLKEKSSPKQH